MTFRNQKGDVHTIDTRNITTKIDLADGTRIALGHDASKRLRTVTNNRGDALVLERDSTGKITTVCGYSLADTYVDLDSTCAASTIKVRYTYAPTGAPLLTSVTDTEGVITSYRYESHSTDQYRLSCITIPGTQTCEVTNTYGSQPGEPVGFTGADQVRKQLMATGEEWRFYYQNLNLYEMPRQPGQIYRSEATMTDPLGQTTLAEYENGLLKRLYGPEGLTKYNWNGTFPKSITGPSGAITSYTYDARHNVLMTKRLGVPGSNDADLILRTGFPPDNEQGAFSTGCIAASQKLCDKPTYTIDPKGNMLTGVPDDQNPYRTDYTYDPAHGMVLTETGPAVGGVRPQKRYRYEQRYAGIRNSAGAIVQAASPVWLLVEEAMCKTGAAPACINTADEVRTLYEYGASGTANALRLKGRVVDHGSGRLNLRTCYAYNAQGNKVSETTPRAGLAACP